MCIKERVMMMVEGGRAGRRTGELAGTFVLMLLLVWSVPVEELVA